MRAPLERRPLADGAKGIEQTRAEMMRLINEGSADLDVIEEARRATLTVRPHDTTGEIAAVFDYVTGLGTPYRFDPVGKEMLQAAGHKSRGRDCDCFVIWAGSLLQALGHPVRVVIGAKRRPLGGEPSWSHTWLEVYDLRQKAWVSFDPVLHLRGGRLAAVGDVAPHAVLWRSAAVSGYEGVNGEQLSGLDGFSLKKLVKGVAKVGKKLTTGVVGGVLKRVVSIVPGGQAALTAIDIAGKAVGVVKAVKKGGLAKGLSAVAKVAAPALIGGGKLGSGLSAGLNAFSSASKAVKQVKKVATVKAPPVLRALKAVKVPAPRPAARAAPRPVPALTAAAARMVRQAAPLVKKALPLAAGAGLVRAAASASTPLNVANLPPRLKRMIAPPAPVEEELPEAEEEAPEQIYDEQEEQDATSEQGEEPTEEEEEQEDFTDQDDDGSEPLEGEG